MMKAPTAWFVGASLILCLALGCKRDPQVQKRNYVDKGASYFQQGKYREAVIEYQSALQIDPRFAEAHRGLAESFLRLGNYRGAYQELLAAVEIDPADAKAQIDLGDLLLAGRNAAEARKHAEAVLRDNPQSPDAEILLAGADAAQNDVPNAIQEAQQAIQMDPNRSLSYLFLAQLQERNKDLVSADKNFQKAISLDPKSSSALITYGQFFARQNRFPDAEKQFQAAVSASPQDPMVRATLARLYLTEGRKDLAEQSLRDAKTALKDNSRGYAILGEFYLAQGEADKASAEYASLHADHPKDARVTRTYAQVLISQNRLDEAAKLDDQLLKASPQDIDAMVIHGDILTRQGKPADAVPILEAAVKAAPDNPAAHYRLGLAYAGVSNYGLAQTEWAQAERLRPNMIEPERALALLAAREGDATLLADSSSQLTKLEPQSAEGYVWHAEALQAKGDTAGAESDLNKAIAKAPQDAAAYTRLGALRMSQKKFDEAAKAYSQALALNSSAVDALTGLVNIDLERKQPQQALRRVQDQISKVPASSNMYLLLGQAQSQNSNRAAAQAAFQKAVDIDPNNTTAYLFLARSEADQGSADQAIANYQQAIQRNPRDFRTYIFLGSLFEARGDWQKAEDTYQEALQVQPDYAIAANNLAYLMLEHDGNINVALSLAQTARKGMPNVPSAADTLGWAYYRQGVYSSAIDTLQEAVNENPDNPTFHYHLGLAYEKAKNLAMAKKQLEYTLKISPNYPHADEIKSLLSQSTQTN
jgi:tetratricopeptide (TPR) repeat protein